jgi:hypothetical protein
MNINNALSQIPEEHPLDPHDDHVRKKNVENVFVLLDDPIKKYFNL